jgi:hypothetical protein
MPRPEDPLRNSSQEEGDANRMGRESQEDEPN